MELHGCFGVLCLESRGMFLYLAGVRRRDVEVAIRRDHFRV